MHRKRHNAVAVVVLMIALVTVACAPPGTATTIPVRLVRLGAGPKTTVVITAGGGAAVRVLLDTGSSGLVLHESAFGPQRTSTGKTITVTYVGLEITAGVVRAPVAFPQAATPLATPAVEVASFGGELPPNLAATGASGILGIAPGTAAAARPALLSPLVQLPAPFSGGFALDGVRPDRPEATLTVGAVAVRPGSVTIPLTRADFGYPGGSPGYRKTFPLCWTIGPAEACGPTSADTGAPRGIVASGLVPDAPHANGYVTTATPITIRSGATTLCAFETSPGDSPRFLDHPVLNTGIRFFFANAVGYDLVRGLVVITPNGGDPVSGSGRQL
ncbi:hypothetical protein [Amycolatopsis tolypomycina]|uniref:hypothetical protein n=1 Tax=Amycolatopsis tolypomycina TaxID=208445 RepID=UPI0033BEB2F1